MPVPSDTYVRTLVRDSVQKRRWPANPPRAREAIDIRGFSRPAGGRPSAEQIKKKITAKDRMSIAV